MLNIFNSARDFEQKEVNVAVLPVGSLEQHSSHLPVGCDSIVVEKVASRIACKLDAYLLPVIAIANSLEHIKSKATVTLRPETLAAVIRDITSSLRIVVTGD